MVSVLAQVLSPPSVSPSEVCLTGQDDVTEPGDWGALQQSGSSSFSLTVVSALETTVGRGFH